jgi:hypothetical protein
MRIQNHGIKPTYSITRNKQETHLLLIFLYYGLQFLKLFYTHFCKIVIYYFTAVVKVYKIGGIRQKWQKFNIIIWYKN